MRKIEFVFILLLIIEVNVSFGQTFSIKAGPNFSTVSYKNSGEQYPTVFTTNMGFNLGGIAEIELSNHLLFETGVVLNSRGYIDSYGADYKDITIKFNPYYLDLPVYLKYRFGSKTLKPFILAGGYFALGIAGKTTTKTIENGVAYQSKSSIIWGPDIRRYDAGLNLGLGLEYKNFVLSVNGLYGLINIYGNESTAYRNELFSISIGYQFLK